MVVRVVLIFTILLCSACFKTDTCQETEVIITQIPNTSLFYPRNAFITRKLQSNKGNFQSIINSWSSYPKGIFPNGIKYSAEGCRAYAAMQVDGSARTSIYPIFCNYGIQNTPDDSAGIFFWLNLYVKDIFSQSVYINLLGPKDDSVTYCYSLPSHDSCFKIPFTFLPSYNNLYGLSFDSVWVFDLQRGKIDSTSTAYNKVWFSYYHGLIGYEQLNSQSWHIAP